MQNNNELTLTLATHSAINVLYFYHISSTYNIRKVADVNKRYSGIYMLLNTIGLSIMVRQGNNYLKIVNLKTQSPYDYDSDYLLVIIRAS